MVCTKSKEFTSNIKDGSSLCLSFSLVSVYCDVSTFFVTKWVREAGLTVLGILVGVLSIFTKALAVFTHVPPDKFLSSTSIIA